MKADGAPKRLVAPNRIANLGPRSTESDEEAAPSGSRGTTDRRVAGGSLEQVAGLFELEVGEEVVGPVDGLRELPVHPLWGARVGRGGDG